VVFNPYGYFRQLVRSPHLAFLTITIAIIVVVPRLSSPHAVTISVDGCIFPFTTYQGAPKAVLKEAGVEVKQDDVITVEDNPSGETVIILERAIPMRASVDGSSVYFATTAKTVSGALNEAGIAFTPYDEVLKDGEFSLLGDSIVEIGSVLTEDDERYSPGKGKSETVSAHIPPRVTTPVSLDIKRAVPLYIHDNGLPVQVFTTKETLAESLTAGSVAIIPGDLVVPPLNSKVTAGMNVFIKRSKGVTIGVDRRTLQIRTLKATVTEVLQDEGISLSDMDRIVPSLETRIKDGISVRITRVREEYVTNEEVLGYTTVYQPDPEMEIDQRRVSQYGREGLRKWVTRLVYEDGEEVERVKEREWVEKERLNTIINYGTKIVIRQLDTPEGSISYWRKMRVYATSYDASGGGKPRSSPGYGYTSLGLRAEKGVIAVDPRVISYYTRMYVPGYGLGVAGDTGGGIIGRFIDLCYAEGEDQPWSSRWVDIYLLTPVPAAEKILWMLPD